ncbi:hypothetical protein [Methanocaldococcus fervens]|uniref:hypothetical protein n=1 Tax=Methanocaldococcus fervens TaxID=83171 RepID=UPI000689CF84|nr:hypothetical protein [Methanocaldococcus fervens]
MYVVDLPYKKLGVELEGKQLIFKMKSKDVEESIRMNFESAALLKILMEQGVLVAEKINKDFKKDNIKIHDIQDIGTVFGVDGRISIGVLPADENRVASILVGFHKDDRHIAVVVKPKKIALLSVIITKLISENIKLD